MNTHLAGVVAALQTQEDMKHRKVALTLAIAAALPATPVSLDEIGDFYNAYCFSKAEKVISEINESVLIDFKDMVRDVRINWEARMEACYRPFRGAKPGCYWTKDLPEMKDSELKELERMSALITSALV